MNRYFAKIDENRQTIYWELDKNTNNIVIKLPQIINHTPHCISVDGNLFVVLDEIKQNNYKVLFLSESPEGMKEYFNFDEFTQEDVFYWATYIGDRDILTDKITTSEYAYYWAIEIGHKDIMIDKITESKYAYLWAKFIGNRDIMIDKITNSEDAYYWAKYIGDRDIMIDKITSSEDAYYWARHIGDKEIMKERITDKDWMKEFEQLP